MTRRLSTRQMSALADVQALQRPRRKMLAGNPSKDPYRLTGEAIDQEWVERSQRRIAGKTKVVGPLLRRFEK